MPHIKQFKRIFFRYQKDTGPQVMMHDSGPVQGSQEIAELGKNGQHPAGDFLLIPDPLLQVGSLHLLKNHDVIFPGQRG